LAVGACASPTADVAPQRCSHSNSCLCIDPCAHMCMPCRAMNKARSAAATLTAAAAAPAAAGAGPGWGSSPRHALLWQICMRRGVVCGGLLWPLCGWQCDSVWSHVHSRVSCMYGCSAQTPGCALFGVPGLIQGMSMQHCRTAKVVCVHDRRQHHQHRLCFSSTPPHSGRGMHLCACVVNAAGGVVCSVGRPQPPVCHQCHPKGGAV
jgi:hypothetical protein